MARANAVINDAIKNNGVFRFHFGQSKIGASNSSQPHQLNQIVLANETWANSPTVALQFLSAPNSQFGHAGIRRSMMNATARTTAKTIHPIRRSRFIISRARNATTITSKPTGSYSDTQSARAQLAPLTMLQDCDDSCVKVRSAQSAIVISAISSD